MYCYKRELWKAVGGYLTFSQINEIMLILSDGFYAVFVSVG